MTVSPTARYASPTVAVDQIGQAAKAYEVHSMFNDAKKKTQRCSNCDVPTASSSQMQFCLAQQPGELGRQPAIVIACPRPSHLVWCCNRTISWEGASANEQPSAPRPQALGVGPRQLVIALFWGGTEFMCNDTVTTVPGHPGCRLSDRMQSAGPDLGVR